MNLRLLNGSLLSACIALSACGGGGGSGDGGTTPPIQGAPPIISFSHVFPQGDATATSGVAWDIVGVKTSLSGPSGASAGQLYDTLRVDVTFAHDIFNALPVPGSPLTLGSQLGVTIAFDVDHNTKTGAIDTCIPNSGITPFEFETDDGSDQGRLTDGNYSILSALGPIYSGSSNPPEEARTTVSGKIFSQTIYLPALTINSGSGIPNIGLDVAALNGSAGLTDCVPAGNGEIFTDQS